jgi:hypothetical protein
LQRDTRYTRTTPTLAPPLDLPLLPRPLRPPPRCELTPFPRLSASPLRSAAAPLAAAACPSRSALSARLAAAATCSSRRGPSLRRARQGAGPRRRGATLKLIASACPVNKMTALPCASSANARLCASRSVWLALQAMGCGRSFSSFLFYILGNFQRYTGATDDAHNRCLGTPTRPAASRITASQCFHCFGLIDAFVPNSFFLPCLDRRRGHACTNGWPCSRSSRGTAVRRRPSARGEASIAVEGRGARPRAADEQLVGGGQGDCVLPESKGGRVYNGGRGACWEAGERVLGGSVSSTLGARLKAWGPRARAECTANMPPMVVTLDVSKLSGWLNAYACCRVERESIKRAARGGHGGGRAWARRRRKQRAGRGPDCGGCWQGHAQSAL